MFTAETLTLTISCPPGRVGGEKAQNIANCVEKQSTSANSSLCPREPPKKSKWSWIYWSSHCWLRCFITGLLETQGVTIDLFSLYILFSHFRPRDALMGIFVLFFFISYAYICTCIRRHLKETIPSSSITWSDMGKQNIQAKEVYWRKDVAKRVQFRLQRLSVRKKSMTQKCQYISAGFGQSVSRTVLSKFRIRLNLMTRKLLIGSRLSEWLAGLPIYSFSTSNSRSKKR